MGIEKGIFKRTELLLGNSLMDKIASQRVIIFGIGGVGSWCAESLVRSGIRQLTIVDSDRICVTNINRQLLALESTIGRNKVDIARERVMDINPDIQVEALKLFAHEDTLDTILAGKPDLVIDAIDALNPKCALLQGTYERGIPIISSMGAALRRNPALVRTGELMDTWGCPLARQVRTNLRKRGIGRGIEVVFSPEKVQFDYKEPEEEERTEFNEQIMDRGRKRKVLGSLPTITGIFGLTLANLALNRLVGDDALHGEESWDASRKAR